MSDEMENGMSAAKGLFGFFTKTLNENQTDDEGIMEEPKAELIEKMAQVQLPQELMEQLDVNALADDFRRKFNRLDDFRNTKDAYESRGAGKKILDFITGDSTMEDAQLKAVEDQAAFAKIIGQLMVLSIMQSQRLLDQQNQLASQQNTISKQTKEIQENTDDLASQHEKLAKQSDKLEKLLNDFIEVQGLTRDGAKRLIEIGTEVKQTRDDLLLSVRNSLAKAEKQFNDVIAQVVEKINRSESTLTTQMTELAEQVGRTASLAQAVGAECTKQIGENRQAITLEAEKISNLQRTVDTQSLNLDGLGAELEKQKEISTRQSTDVSSRLQMLDQEFAAYRDAVQQKLKKLQVGFFILAFGIACAIALAADIF